MIDYYIRMQYVRRKVYSALRSSERFFKTDMVYLAKGGFWLSLKQVSTTLISFLLAISFAHFVSKDNYGVYKYIITIAGVIGGFSLAGFKTSIIQATAKGAEGNLRSEVKESLMWGVLTGFVSICFSAYYALNHNYVLASAFVITAVAIPITNSLSLYDSFLVGRRDFRTSYKTHVGRAVLSGLFLFGAIAYSGDPIIMSTMNFIVPAIFAYTAYKWVIKTKKPNSVTDPEATSYGRHLSIMGLVGTFTNRLDSILVFHYFGAAPLAIYSFAGAIPDHILNLFRQTYFLALPKFSQSNKNSVKKTILHKSMITGGIMLLVFFAYWLSADLIFKLFFPQYMESVRLSQWFALNFVLGGLTLLPGTFLDSQTETSYKYTFTWFHTIVRISLMLLFIIPYGILGIIFAEIIARILSACLLFYFVYKI